MWKSWWDARRIKHPRQEPCPDGAVLPDSSSAAGSGGGWTIETISAADTEEWLPADAGRININTATVELLTELPGIGDALAARIVEYRETNGPFAAADEIMAVKGIGEKTYRNIEEMITVEGAAT